MGAAILDEIIIIFALSIAVLLFCHKLRIPTIVGFLITGILCGPYGFAFIKNVEDVQTLADIGIVLLLFTIGMEFSLAKIFIFKRYFILGGTLQVALTVAAGAAASLLLGHSPNQALFWGFLLALSSTAIVLRSLEERRESHSPYGNLSLGILIFQDVVAVVMMLIIPLLGEGKEQPLSHSYFYSALFGTAVLSAAVLSGHYLIPRLFHMIARTKSRELFLLCTLTICFSAAWLASAIGMSLALGAFLAGLLISDSEYKSQAIGDILPFQELFTSFFFVSIGMLLDLSFVLQQPLLIAAVTMAIFLVKGAVLTFTAVCVGLPLRAALLTGFALCQIGEFAFVLSKSGMENNLATPYSYQLFLSAALLSMAITPFLIRLAPKLVHYILKLPMPLKLTTGLKPLAEHHESAIENHIIIIGYGLSGRNMALAAQQAEIPYVILEMNPDTVRQEKKRGEPIFFGDATHEAVLQHAYIDKAKAVAVLINDPVGAGRVVEKVRQLNSEVYLVVRTRYIKEMQQLYNFGADEVVTDEFGASIEVFTRVLRKLSVHEDRVGSIVESLRSLGQEFTHLLHEYLGKNSENKKAKNHDCHMKSYFVEENSSINGVSLEKSGLKELYGITAVLIKRKSGVIVNLQASEKLLAGDAVVLVGREADLKRAHEALFQSQVLILA